MTRDLLTIAEDESVLMAWELMCKAEVHHTCRSPTWRAASWASSTPRR
ncbi:CBS domain-containing protein [Actinomadura sediminis]|uniref:CBS domain-containing protein n=1 Tax=Actinomadura sediminis TaxID=1038904 RepID=A0ABW3EFN5_9ACTN